MTNGGDSSSTQFLLSWHRLEEIQSTSATGQDVDNVIAVYTNNAILAYIGVILNSISVLLCLLSIVLLITFRKHRVVQISQPYFLVLICIGDTSIATTGILFGVIGIVTSARGNDPLEFFKGICTSCSTMFFSGTIGVYCALFGKMWRLQKVTKFRRNQTVKVEHVTWPGEMIQLVAAGIIVAWHITDPPVWKESSDGAGGYCSYNPAFYWPLMALIDISALLGFWMSWKIPQNLPEELNDWKQIQWVYLVHLIVFVLYTILYYLGRYLEIHFLTGTITLVVIFPLSIANVLLLIAPKCYCIWYERNHNGNLPSFLQQQQQQQDTNTPARIGAGNIVVRGVDYDDVPSVSPHRNISLNDENVESH